MFHAVGRFFDDLLQGFTAKYKNLRILTSVMLYIVTINQLFSNL